MVKFAIFVTRLVGFAPPCGIKLSLMLSIVHVTVFLLHLIVLYFMECDMISDNIAVLGLPPS
jgi:hypothetical protein